MDDRIGEVVKELEEVTQGTRVLFGGLSNDQLNWRPAAESWSIAQCLDHLIAINGLYFPLFDSMRAGPVRPTFWERYSPLSGLFGRFLIKTLSPEYPKKLKTSPKAQPATGKIDDGILNRFARHQAELIAHLHNVPYSIDRGRTIITSPLLQWVTYSLDDCLTIIAVHETRHFQQAKRVMEAEGFPKSA